MKRISVLAVMVGAVVDVAASVLATLPISWVAMFRMAMVNPRIRFTSAMVLAAVHGSPLLYGGFIVADLAGSLLAGAVAAIVARHDEVLNGACSSVITVSFNAYHLVTGTGSNSVWVSVALFIMNPMLGAYGGYLISRRRALKLGRALESVRP